MKELLAAAAGVSATLGVSWLLFLIFRSVWREDAAVGAGVALVTLGAVLGVIGYSL